MIGFRTDIEGLRAVAVLLVVLDHLHVPGFQGGFIGVDVFLVISGYLITSLLAAEYAKRGSISIPGFYLRRARRILPAAVTVILAVVVAARLLLNPLRVDQVHHDALWTLFFGANFNCINQATDYFAQWTTPSPFQHYWSLAVEEQFYLVWPALFLLVAGIRVLHWRVRAGIAIGALGAASLAWSVVATAGEPLSAYFSTFTRAWELALGALIGVCATRATQFGRLTAARLSFAGAALLAISLGLIDTSTPFPGDAALLPTVATALFILGGLTAQPPLPNRALSLPPLRFVGRISYSVYLWHWPLIVFAAALYPTSSNSLSTTIVIAALTLALSTASFYLVEQPARRTSAPRTRRAGSVAFGTCAVVALFVGALSVLPVDRGGVNVSAAAASAVQALDAAEPARAATVSARLDATYPDVLRAWQQKVRAGLRVRRLPSSLQPLQPHLDRYVEPSCNRSFPGTVPEECVVGGPQASHVAVLTGDSHAGMFQIALARALGRGSWRLHILQRGRCGWAGSLAPGQPVTPSECRGYQAQALSRIRALRPDVLVLSQDDVVTPYRTASEVSATLRRFSRLARRVVVLGHTPGIFPFGYCLSGSADVSRCFKFLSRFYRAEARLEQRLARGAGVEFVDTSKWFCAPVGSRSVCPPVIDNAPVFRDGAHVTSSLEVKLVPLFRAILRGRVPST